MATENPDFFQHSVLYVGLRSPSFSISEESFFHVPVEFGDFSHIFTARMTTKKKTGFLVYVGVMLGWKNPTFFRTFSGLCWGDVGVKNPDFFGRIDRFRLINQFLWPPVGFRVFTSQRTSFPESLKSVAQKKLSFGSRLSSVVCRLIVCFL